MKTLCLLVALLCTAGVLRAEPGLDLILLLDRSKSMAAVAPVAPAATRLSLDLLARNASAYRLQHRAAVVGFGSSAHVELPWTAVGSRTPTRLESVPRSARGDTDLLEATATAARMLDALPRDGDRRRAIVMVTDGVPSVSGKDPGAYAGELQRLVAARTRAASSTIDIVLVGDGGARPAWTAAATVHSTRRNAADVLASLHAVVTRLAGTPAAESAPSKTAREVDTIVVPPYLETIVFDVFRSAHDTTVQIFPPGSRTPVQHGTPGIEELTLGDVLATLVVTRPEPGEWTIRKSRADAHVRIRSQQYFPRGVLLRPEPTRLVRKGSRVDVAYRVVDHDLQPIRERPDSPLSLHLDLVTPEGRVTPVAMERAPDLGGATFRSAREAECGTAGRYWTDVRVVTVDARGRQLDVYRDRWSGFTVTDAPASVAASATAAPRPVHSAATRKLAFAAGAAVVAAACVTLCLRPRKPRP